MAENPSPLGSRVLSLGCAATEAASNGRGNDPQIPKREDNHESTRMNTNPERRDLNHQDTRCRVGGVVQNRVKLGLFAGSAIGPFFVLSKFCSHEMEGKN